MKRNSVCIEDVRIPAPKLSHINASELQTI